MGGEEEEEATVVGPFDFFRRRLIYLFRRSIWACVLATTDDVVAADDDVARLRLRSIVDCRRTTSGRRPPSLAADEEVAIPRHVPLPLLLLLAVTKTAMRRNIII